MRIPNVLSIAGSDPSGGAGIQADLKTFSALGAYGMSVLTALTAQNTQGVTAIHSVPASFIAAQCEALFADIHLDAIKLGMLGEAEAVRTLSDLLKQHRAELGTVVLDPVMVAKGGQRLLGDSAIGELRSELLPLVDLLTPNLPEAAVLLGQTMAMDEESMRVQGRQLVKLGAQAVLMKGGHLPGDSCPDWLITPSEEVRFPGVRIASHNTHGTGCSLSAALAALRPQSSSWSDAIGRAKTWLSEAIRSADRLSVGHGMGPIHHFHRWW